MCKMMVKKNPQKTKHILTFIFHRIDTHTCKQTRDIGSKTLRVKKENHEGETTTIKPQIETQNEKPKL